MFGSSNSIRVGKSGDKRVLSRGVSARQSVVASAQMGGGGRSGAGQNLFGNEHIYIGGVDVNTPYLDDIHHKTLCGMYRDIYYHDAVAGSAVDLMSNLPFSNFKLNVPASKDADKIGEVFESNLTNLRVNTMLPPAAREQMVYGWYTAMLIYKHSDRSFTDTLPISAYDTEVIDNILFSRDPIIRVTQPQNIMAFLRENSPTVKAVLDRLTPEIVSTLRSGNFELDPISTIYWPRKTFTGVDKGESMYRRIIPLYMLEKVLFRGTLTMANRRQTSIKHVLAGDDMWQPTPDEFTELLQMFQTADRDPIGGMVATRNSVSINEVGGHSDLWKWNEVAPDFDAKKLLAFGINEAFLSGDMTYSNMETALSVFMEQLRAFRENCAASIFYNKLFPLISITNDFTKARYGELDNDTITAGSETANFKRLSSGLDKIGSSHDYIIPTIDWDKKLKPEGDEELFTIMEKLEEKGVPIPVRVWAAAGGMNLDDLMNQYKSGINDVKHIEQIKSKYGASESDGESDGDGEASIAQLMSDLKPVGLGKRKFSDRQFELSKTDGGGKRHYVHNQDRMQKQANHKIAATLKRMAIAQGKPKNYYMAAKKNEVEQ